MSDFYTYVHCKPDGEIFYVGKGSGRRAHSFYKRGRIHQCYVKKYGKENIGVFVFPCDSEEQAFSDEIQQIKQLRSEGYELANVADGGEGASGYSHLPEAKAIISKTHKGVKRSDETKAKMSDYSRNRTEEHTKKLAESKRGSKHTPESIEKMRLAKSGKTLTEEHKLRIAKSLKINHPLKGKHHSEEAKAKISASKKGVSAKPFSEEHRKNISDARKAYFANKKSLMMSGC